MIAGIKPYPAYRDSGLPWLGKVPEHWEIRRGKALFICIDDRSSTGDEELLTVSSERGVIPRHSAKVTMFKAESYVGYKLCWPGDLVINSLWAWGRGLGVSHYHGIVSSAYGVYRLHPEFQGAAGFIDALVRSAAFNWELQVRSKGIWISRLQLTDESFLGSPFPVPPPSEQAAIVRFLDHADRRIRRYIAAKTKLITLLNEQRKAIIHHAVTRGLDLNARFTSSGMEWLGDVPEHWILSRVKNEFECLDSIRVPLSSTERGAMTTRAYDYYGASGVIDRVDDYLFDDELLLLAEDGANLVLRNLPLVVIARGKFWVNNHAHILRPRRGNLEFLGHVLEGYRYDPWISGAAQPKLTQDRLMSVAMAVPDRAEQDRIVDWLATETGPVNTGISQARREVELMREWRVRLIADVVTGKLDVRETAVRLPAESDELEQLDDADALADGVESEDGTDPDAAAAEVAG